jgi:hypothetical protein
VLPKGHVFDTLATAFWANGLAEEAVRAERQAIAVDVGKKRFYQSQINKFISMTYDDSVKEQEHAQSQEINAQ